MQLTNSKQFDLLTASVDSVKTIRSRNKVQGSTLAIELYATLIPLRQTGLNARVEVMILMKTCIYKAVYSQLQTANNISLETSSYFINFIFCFIWCPGAMSGGFNFQVNDGVNFTPRQIFSITARALVISLERNRPLKVFPGKSPPLSESLWIKDEAGFTVFYFFKTFFNKSHDKITI